MTFATAQELAHLLGVANLDGEPGVDLILTVANGVVEEYMDMWAAPMSVPVSAKAAALRMAADVLDNPLGFTTETIEALDRSTTTRDKARTLGFALTAQEQAQLSMWHRSAW